MTCITHSPCRAAVGSEGEDVNWKSHTSSKGGNGYSCPADHCHVGFRLVVAKFLIFQKSLGIRLLSKNLLIKKYMYIYSEFFKNSIMVPEPFSLNLSCRQLVCNPGLIQRWRPGLANGVPFSL